jgi:hypothetical protein
MPTGVPDEKTAELLVSVYMTEYTALRQEVLLHISRVSTLVIYSIGGSGALVGSAAFTNFADRPEVFASLLFFVAAVLGLVAATCVGIEANILVINGYLAARAKEITGVISGVAADPSLVKPEAFSWENKSISRPTKLLTRETARSWGGPIFEILVVVVLAFVTLGGACWIFAQHDTARTFLTIGLLVLDVAETIALVAWGLWSHGNWAGKTDSAGNKAS